MYSRNVNLVSFADVLRRSSVRSRTEIFQGTPDKDGMTGEAKSAKKNALRPEGGEENDIGDGQYAEDISEQLTAGDKKMSACT